MHISQETVLVFKIQILIYCILKEIYFLCDGIKEVVSSLEHPFFPPIIFGFLLSFTGLFHLFESLKCVQIKQGMILALISLYICVLVHMCVFMHIHIFFYFFPLLFLFLLLSFVISAVYSCTYVFKHVCRYENIFLWSIFATYASTYLCFSFFKIK